MNKSLALSLSLLSGLLLSVGFPPWDLGPLAFVALVPLLCAVSRSTGVMSFILGYLPGAILAGSFFYPLTEIKGFPISGYLVIALVCGAFYGLFATLYYQITRWTGWPPVIIAPALWVAIEFLRANISFLSNPGFLLGYTQHGFTSLIQIATFTSVYGVSFLIVLINATVAEIFLVLSRKDFHHLRSPLKPGVYIRAVSVVAILVMVLVFGFMEQNRDAREGDAGVKISLVQPNVSQEINHDREGSEKIMGWYRELTNSSSAVKSDLIVWPESSTPGYFISVPEIRSAVSDLVRETGIPLVLGSSARDKTAVGKTAGIKHSNSAYLVNKEGEIKGTYRKIKLVPFWEYLPLEGSFKWPRWLVPKHGNTIAGKDASIFRIKGNSFGVVICWEVLYPDFFRNFTRQGPDFMLNLSNENVFGWTAAPYKVQAMAVFRAIESRKSLLRCNLTGMTSHIDPYGRETTRVTDENGKDLMVQGVMTAEVPILSKTTFYTRYGDVFAYICVVWSVLMLIYTLILKFRTGSENLAV